MEPSFFSGQPNLLQGGSVGSEELIGEEKVCAKESSCG